MDRRRWTKAPAEQKVIRHIVELRAVGLSLRAIAEQLNAEEARPLPVLLGDHERSDRWNHLAVRRILAFQKA